MIEKMFKNTQILDSKKHSDLKIVPTTTYSHAKEMLFSPIAQDEFFLASKDYMIAFKGNDKQIMPVVILGSDKNIMIDENENWAEKKYVPKVVRTYPFGVTVLEDGKKLIVVDEDAKSISKVEGNALFDSEEKANESTQKVIDFVTQSYASLETASTYFSKLLEHKILDLVEMTLEKGEEKSSLGQFFIVNEQRLNKLNSREYKKLGNSGMLNFIYLHLNSLSNRYEV